MRKKHKKTRIVEGRAVPVDGTGAVLATEPPRMKAKKRTAKSELSVVNCRANEITAHPGKCDTYIQCSHGNPILMKCPPGLHFNKKKNYCDWIATANCNEN